MRSNLSSEVKVYIPKIKGKATLTKDWYVYCYFTNPKTNKRDYKFMIKAGINRKKTLSERRRFAKDVQRALIYSIEVNGFSPFEDNNAADFEKIEISVLKGLQIGFDNKKESWSIQTLTSAKSHLDRFIEFIKENKLQHLLISKINKRHITTFLNELIKKGNSPKTRNNYRATLSSIFTQLVNDDYLDRNIILNIQKLKAIPKKNIAFNKKQLKDIKKYLLKNDPYLYEYIQFVGYAFLRPIEVCRVKLKDIDIDGNFLRVHAKTGHQTVYIIDKLIDIIKKYKIGTLDKNMLLFTKDNKPYHWTTKETDRRTYFGKRFSKLKKALDYGEEYSIYSFRHSFILDLYNSFINSGLTVLQAKHKLMSITRHQSLSGLENYLRGIGAILPKDYSDDFTLEF